MDRRSLLAASVSLPFCGAAFAQGVWPTKAVRLVVPSAAGSAPDILTRIVAAELQRRLGQAFIADDKPGVGGTLGADIVAKAPADGYTLVMGNIGSHAMSAGVYPRLPYDPLKSFEPVAMVATTPSLMTVSSELPVRNLQEFVALARREGENITFGSGGNGSSSHLAGEYLNQVAGLRMRHVPYKDVQQALGDVASQRVNVMISNLPPAMALVRAQRLRPIAVTTRQRSAALPAVPTMQEAEVDLEQTVWFGLFAPAGTPAEVVARINAEVGQVLRDPAVAERIATAGATVETSAPQAMRGFVAAEVDKWKRVATTAGVHVD